MKKSVTIILKVHGALALGAMLALGLVQDDPWLKSRVEQMIVQSISDILRVPCSLKVEKLNLLVGQLVVRDIKLVSSKGDWSFVCPTLLCNFSWLSWFKRTGIETDLVFVTPEVYTAYDKGKCALEDPLLALIRAPTTLPIKLTRCSMQNSSVRVVAPHGEITMHGSSMTEIGSQSVLTNLFWADGSVKRNTSLIAEQISGLLTVDVPIAQPENYTVKIHLGCSHPQAPARRCIFYGHYKDTVASFQWYPEDRSLLIAADNVHFNKDTSCDLYISGELNDLPTYVPLKPAWKNLYGKGSFKGKAVVTDNDVEYEGTVHVKECMFADVHINDAVGSVKGNKKNAGGTFKSENKAIPLEGTWDYSLDTDELKSEIKLSVIYDGLPKIKIEKEGARGLLQFKNGHLVLTCKALAAWQRKKLPVKATIESDMTTVTFKGTLDKAVVSGTCMMSPFRPLQIICKDQKGKIVLKLDSEQHMAGGQLLIKPILSEDLKGTVDFNALKETISLLTGYQLQGLSDVSSSVVPSEIGIPSKATVRSEGPTKAGSLKKPVGAIKSNLARIGLHVAWPSLATHITATGVHIKLPSTYNFVTDFKGTLEYDRAQKKLKIQNVKVKLHKGHITMTHGSLFFNDDGGLAFAHLPCTYENVFVSWHKDFFATIVGAATATHTRNRWVCQGLMMIDKAHLRSNLLSSQVQKELITSSGSTALSDIDLQVAIQTVNPVEVKTPFFKTQAQIDATIMGAASKPQLTGSIELRDGVFEFPYKPLYVTLGKLFLSSQQPDDPTISLTAKNKIKKYSVTMRVSGTLHEPKISFDSSPQLAEENIVTLLFSGTEEGPLYMAMPHMIMMQLEQLLFGSGEHLSKAQQFFKGLLKPLKNVRFIPKLGDDQNKELQGSLEVDINDRLRARAKNNLKLSQETQVEVEYALFDDMSIKAVRDKEGSLGGELEMRWKF